jgi:hypothetical protein
MNATKDLIELRERIFDEKQDAFGANPAERE